MTEPQQIDFTNPMVGERLLMWTEYQQMLETLKGLMDTLTGYISSATQQSLFEINQARMAAYNELVADKDRHKESLRRNSDIEIEHITKTCEAEIVRIKVYLESLRKLSGN